MGHPEKKEVCGTQKYSSPLTLYKPNLRKSWGKIGEKFEKTITGKVTLRELLISLLESSVTTVTRVGDSIGGRHRFVTLGLTSVTKRDPNHSLRIDYTLQ